MQKIYNRLEFNQHLNNKKALFINMRNYYTYCCEKEDVFDTLPLTFHIKTGTSDPQYFKYQQYKDYVVIFDKLSSPNYYKLNKLNVHAPDIRYIQDHGKQIGILDKENEVYFKIIKDHRLNEKLGSRLSVFQELYRLDSSIMDDINDWNTFPELPKIITDENLIGYIIKFNVRMSNVNILRVFLVSNFILIINNRQNSIRCR